MRPLHQLEIIEGHVSLGQVAAYAGDMARTMTSSSRRTDSRRRDNPAALPDLDQMIAIARCPQGGDR